MNVRREMLERRRLRGRGDPDLARSPRDPGADLPQASDAGGAAVSTPAAREVGPPSPDRPNQRGGGRSESSDDIQFHPGAVVIEEAPRSPIRHYTKLVIVTIVGCAFAWSYFGRFESYTSAPGKIQMVGGTNVVEALAAGKVAKIHIRDGDVVKAGDVLIELDPTDALAARTIIDEKLTDVRAENSRLWTEIGAARADPIDPNVKIPWGDSVPVDVREREDGVAQADLAKLASQIATLTSQKRDKEADRDKYANDIEAQKALVSVTQENLTMIESLVKSGYNSQAKYLDMKALLDDQQVTQKNYEGSLDSAKEAIITIDNEIAKSREIFVSGATQTASNNDQMIIDLTEQLVKADRMLEYMTLRAPTAGAVHAIAVTTVDQVVKPGQQLMQIVPSDSGLEIVAYVANTDIGFIRKGDPATIKLAAFTYGTYGAIDGTVTDVANDALALQGKATLQSSSLDGTYRQTSQAQMTGKLQFPITVRAARSTMAVANGEIPLVSGMSVSVEILTEYRRGIDYIASPLLELFSSAAHEHP
jgi:hemolysin D